MRHLTTTAPTSTVLTRTAVAMALLLTASVHAQQIPSQQRGFNADTAYQIGDIDHINLFNGQLSLTVPLGQSYPVGPNLSFQLTLAYSSNGWDQEDADCSDSDGIVHYNIPIEEPNSNAGFGWRIQPGKLGVERDAPAPFSSRSYLSPDGGEIFFHEELHPGDGNQDDTWFSTDGSYLRMRYNQGCVDGTSDCYQIDFPDGTIHEFHDFSPPNSLPEDRDWRVTRMFDRFTIDHNVTFDYTTTAGQWKIADSHDRKHTIFFDGDKITKVEMAAFGSVSAKATYELVFTSTQINRQGFALSKPDCHDTIAIPVEIMVPLLTELKQPESTFYTMVYDTQSTSVLSGGINRLRLPTGGRYDWTYQQINFDSQIPSAPGAREYANTAYPVHTKKSFTGSTEIGQWTYDYFTTLAQQDNGTSPFEAGSGSDPSNGAPGTFQPCFHTVTVTDPNGDTTVNYFDSVSSGWQYGLPFRRCDMIDGSPTLAAPFLSQEIYSGSPSSGTKLRSVYVTYDSDGRVAPSQARNARLTYREVVYHGDGGNKRTEQFTDFDGLGHFRTVETGGDFIGSESRTVTTNYNDDSGTLALVPEDKSPGAGNSFTLPGRDDPWVLNTYDLRTVEGGGGDKTTQEFWFNTDNGFLNRSRTWKGASRSGQDVLVDFEEGAGGTGRVAIVRTYGGDPGGLSTAALKDITLTTSDATTQVVHRYEHGALKSSEYIDCNDLVILNALDTDIDKNTGMVKKSRDSAGIATTFVYDQLGRRTGDRPAGGAWTKTTYNLPSTATSTAAPQLKVESFANGATGGTLLSETKYLFDGIGRLRQETLSYPEGTGIGGSTRDFTFDGVGRRIKESMWEDLTITQDSTFDRFGRVTKIDPADPNLADVIIRYTGDRLIERTTKVATETDGSETWTCSREERDALGRLVKVTENRGSDAQGTCATGPGFVTTYSYDEADRLTKVCAGGGAPCGQERLFTYDNRGFLTSEKHPEIGPAGNGTVNYAYDANGNVLAKDIVGSSNFSLRYGYDAANRLVGIDQVTGSGPNDLRPLKAFHYARENSGNDKRAGKLIRATRTNWVDIVEPLFSLLGTHGIQLSQAYRYEGLDGRVSTRQTQYTFSTFHFAFDTGFAYDPLGNLSALTYPECRNAAECPPGEAPDRTVSFNYTRGYLSGVPGYANSINYQLGGMVNTIEHANGVTETITHADNNLSRPKTIATSGVSGGDNWSTGNYVYDGAGNIKAIDTHTYRYDRMSRLKRGEIDLVGATNAVQEAAYDVYGNITSLKTGGVTRLTPVASTNRMTAGAYDAGGNLTAISHGSENYQYVFDALNMMTSLQSNTDQARIHIYDAADERVVTFDCALVQCQQRSRTTYTIRDLGGRVLRVFEDLPTEPFTWKRDYIYRGSQLLASVQPDPGVVPEQPLHLHLDHLGTPRQITNSAGIEVAIHSYYPFGGEATMPSQNEVALKFTGHERDENGSSGEGMLDYMHARYCSPGLGRFLSIDPINTGVAGNPQSWNKYSYALSNPVRYRDPDGQAVESPWDIANVALGLASLGANVAAGNVIGAAVDTIGLAYDLTATAVPGLPGFAGTLINSRRASKAVSAALPGLPRALSSSANAVQVTSRIKDSTFAVRHAKRLSQAAQRDVDNLVAALAKGNNNPGIGTRALGSNFFELRGANAGRVIIKEVDAGVFEVVGKFQGHARGDAANAVIIKRFIDDYTP